MKKSTMKTILAMATIISLFLACCEADTSVNQILWSGLWLCICGISARNLTKYMDKEELEEQV